MRHVINKEDMRVSLAYFDLNYLASRSEVRKIKNKIDYLLIRDLKQKHV